jgi:hypothetical protein
LHHLSKRQKTLEIFFKEKRDIHLFGNAEKRKKVDELAERKNKILSEQLDQRKKLVTKMR